jgi:hypothetical protein
MFSFVTDLFSVSYSGSNYVYLFTCIAYWKRVKENLSLFKRIFEDTLFLFGVFGWDTGDEGRLYWSMW